MTTWQAATTTTRPTAISPASSSRSNPGIRRLVTNNLAYLAHAVLLAGSHLGIRQFLDLGSGFPGPGSVREAAQGPTPLRRSPAADLDRAVARYGSRLAREA